MNDDSNLEWVRPYATDANWAIRAIADAVSLFQYQEQHPTEELDFSTTKALIVEARERGDLRGLLQAVIEIAAVCLIEGAEGIGQNPLVLLRLACEQHARVVEGTATGDL